MLNAERVNIFWFRRDLRLIDNAALYHSLKDKYPVIPLFIFDKNILDKLENKADSRVEFIYETVLQLQKELSANKSSLQVYYDFPENVLAHLLSKYTIEKMFTNHDYEPYAIERDKKINDLLKKENASLITYKDQVIFEKDEILKDDGKPYTVFTPYSRKWKEKLNDFFLRSYPSEKYFSNLYKSEPNEFPSLEKMKFKPAGISFPSKKVNNAVIKNYYEKRDFPRRRRNIQAGRALALWYYQHS